MKVLLTRDSPTARLASACLFLVLLVGCVTGPRIDWNARIGNFTYDQTVLELGPPDRLAPLTDGTKVGDWLTSRGSSHGYVPTIAPYGGYGYLHGPPAVFYTESPMPDRYLRLTFSPDGKLLTWRQIYR